MTRSTRPGVAIAALIVTCASALAACSSGTGPAPFSGAFGKIPPAAPGPRHAGTITWAKSPGTAPTWILPLVTAVNFTARNTSQFSALIWRPLYWFSNGVQPVQTPAMSLANPPVWSNGDKTVTVTLKSSYKWSDGQPITSKDVLFNFDEIRAAIAESPANWGPYTPGLGIPDEVASVTTPSSKTIVFNLKKAVNPGWFYDDELPSLSPMPAHAWAKASASGPALDFTVPANAKKIWDFLNAAARSEATYTTNPLWQVVDGPYKLTQFNSGSGAFTMTPNPAYGGPHVRKMSVLQAVPFTSDTAELNAVRAGRVDVGYLPLTGIKQAKTVKAAGYNVFGYPGFGFSYVTYNFLDKTGNFDKVVAQLYFRQAMAHLENEKGWIKAFLDGAGGQDYGPIPAIPSSPYAPPDAVTDPYPFSVSTAISLLKRHGWTVTPGGTDTCAKPGPGPGRCGAGIPAGTKLSFN
ncbi:MAG TPA: ABC transporter substrate-binding protein, partial [Streptosporangiaceae bacterium]|nr:ABC transporter substrate-binding protein [Streptosporangiaceae bacterium]